MLVDISKVNDHFAGDEELIGELLDVFESSYPEVIDRLEVAISNNKSEDIKLEAHTLKGMISNFFAEKLRLCAFDIEENSSSLSQDQLNSKLEILKSKIPLMLNEIRNAKL